LFQGCERKIKFLRVSKKVKDSGEHRNRGRVGTEITGFEKVKNDFQISKGVGGGRILVPYGAGKEGGINYLREYRGGGGGAVKGFF